MPLATPELTELHAALSRRGLAVHRAAPPFRPPWPVELGERFYRLMGRYSFRLWLRDVLAAGEPLAPEDLARYCSPRASETYWGELVRAGLAQSRDDGRYLATWPGMGGGAGAGGKEECREEKSGEGRSRGDKADEGGNRDGGTGTCGSPGGRKGTGGSPGGKGGAGGGGAGRGEPFGELLEWFMAEVLAREFGVAAGRRLRLRGGAHGGDYDLLAVMERELVYLEIKSSPPRHLELGDASAFLDRLEDVLPRAAFFVVDTWFRLRDKIRPFFEDELHRRMDNRSGSAGPEEPGGKAAPRRAFSTSGEPLFTHIEHELYHHRGRIYLVNAKRDLINNLKLCWRHHLRHGLGW